VPSITGTPHFFASALACALSPNSSSASGEGPTKVIASSAQRRARCAFSLRTQRVAFCSLGGGDDGLDIEVGAGAATGDFAALVSRAHMQRQPVVSRINRDGGKAGLTRGARDANGNLAAIGDQKFFKGHEVFPLALAILHGRIEPDAQGLSGRVERKGGARPAGPAAYI
jgi:hypothetical protein